MREILKKTLASIRPDDLIIAKVDSTIKKINRLLKKKGLKAKCVKGGSIAKDTFLKNAHDADIFVRFDYSMKDEQLSDILEPVLKEEFKVERVHGSRDYFQIRGDITFEIVPVLRIDDYRKAQNVTDMSPLHVGYVNGRLKKGQTDEIRLAKQFCKSAKVYGAESYIKGFSGHILDLLIIYYGSFERLLMQAAVWGDRAIIDIENHLKDPLSQLNSAKTHSPLIIVDPVQPDRNAAAALSREKFEAFKNACRSFLRKPSISFFRITHLDKEKTAEELKKSEELFFLEAEPLKGKKDVVGSKLLKAYEFMLTQLKKNDFKILKTEWEFDEKALFYFIIRKEVLPEKIILPGPPISEKEGVKRFKAKHKKAFEKDRRLYAEEKRKYRTTEPLMKDLLKEKYVVERVKKISVI